jgi:hypothetical protein
MKKKKEGSAVHTANNLKFQGSFQGKIAYDWQWHCGVLGRLADLQP